MNITIKLHTESAREKACLLIHGIPPEAELHEVVIRPSKEDRSAEQNALYWNWLTAIGNFLGMRKDEMHLEYKEKFLVPIFTRDSKSYRAMVESVKAVRRAGMNEEADNLKREIIRLTSTTDCSVAQFSEYLEDIQHHSASLGIKLPTKREE